MFAAARISEASVSVIQSDAEPLDMRQSSDEGVDEAVLVPVPDLDPAEPPLPRSFFAQPEPLKWMAGDASCFFIVPSAPHSGQKRGPESWTPWMTSVRWRQAVQV
jgi:hypothetical protein